MTPIVGIGVIVIHEDGKILFGKCRGQHAPYWSLPGGHLAVGERFEQCAQREVWEETGISISPPEVIAITNNLYTWQAEGIHSISVILTARFLDGELVLKEPDKCEEWGWYDPTELPYPHFEASVMAVQCWLEKKCYLATPHSFTPALDKSPSPTAANK